MRKAVLLMCSLMITGLLTAQDSSIQKLETLLNAFASLGRFNGSVLIARNDTILLQKGYGIKNAGDKTMNDGGSKFQIASITKQFTAAVILKLVEMHKMALTDKLDKYYPGFPNGNSITIENLLTHTSGLHDFTETDSAITETDEQRMVPYLRKLAPDFAPGTAWHYSNSGYVMLGYIIQKVSGMSYWKAVRTFIFDPLHMDNSGFDFAHLSDNNKTVGYDVLSDTVKTPSVITDSTVPFGAGAIYSTVGDMYKWHLGLQAYQIVGKDLMNRAYAPCAMHNYGYGWQIDSVYGRKMVSHSGAISGFGSNFARIPEDGICIVLLSNKSGSTIDLMHITDRLLAILYDQPYSIPVRRMPVEVSEALLKPYEGTYTIEDLHLVIDIRMDKGLLVAQPYRDGHPGPLSVLLGINDTHFFDKNDEELEVSFNIDRDGKVNGMNILQMGVSRYAKKIK